MGETLLGRCAPGVEPDMPVISLDNMARIHDGKAGGLQRDTSMGGEAIIHGKVVDLHPAKMGHPHLKWRVVLEVEAVLSGNFPKSNFIFGIHSPAKSRIVKGGRYVIHVLRKSPTEFFIKSIDPWTDTAADMSGKPFGN